MTDTERVAVLADVLRVVASLGERGAIEHGEMTPEVCAFVRWDRDPGAVLLLKAFIEVLPENERSWDRIEEFVNLMWGLPQDLDLIGKWVDINPALDAKIGAIITRLPSTRTALLHDSIDSLRELVGKTP